MKITVPALLLAMPVLASGAAAQTRPVPPLAPSPTAQDARPLPGPVFEIPEFTRAVERGTRTRTGRPGAGNRVQRARYDIVARLDPASATVSGTETVVYLNNSPDTLDRIAVHLRQNAFRAGNRRVNATTITGGVDLTEVAANGHMLEPLNRGVTASPITNTRRRSATADGYLVDGTVLWIRLRSPLAPHDSAQLRFAWSYEVPETPSDGREGRAGNVFFMGYWYPQVAVYDDVHGWVADQYLLGAEFYMDPADYDVRLTVPHGWAVDATGTLENPTEVLSASTLDRLAGARRTGDVVRILTPGGDDAATVFAPGGPTATWHFTAHDIRDLAWGASDEYAWDATRALVDRGAGDAPDTVDIRSFYRIHAPAAAWQKGGARFTRDAIEQLSKYLWPYPWPKMTSMEGVLTSGGMEYPMMTLMAPWADTLSLAGDLMHETGHMWFPMMVGSNEKRYPWMDEGLTQFDVAQAMKPLYGEPRTGGRPNDSETGQRMLYTRAARAGHDNILMWPGDLYPQDLYFIMYYDKTAQALVALRGVLGEETFHRALREYGRRWLGRHPYPYDFFNTVNDVAGQDLGWFWQTWFYQAWPLDQAIASVEQDAQGYAITIEDRGLAPMPVPLTVTRANGSTERVDVPVDVWLKGARRYVAHVGGGSAVMKVEIDAAGAFPDIDRGNQLWRAR